MRSPVIAVTAVLSVVFGLGVPAAHADNYFAELGPGVFVGNGGGNGDVVDLDTSPQGDSPAFGEIPTDGASTLVLAPDGLLWAGDAKGVLEAYTGTQTQGISPGDSTPQVTITTTNHAGATMLAFDPAGDLWAGGPGEPVEEWTPSQLTTSGSPSPAQTIAAGVVADGNGMAFDPAGDMWVSDLASGLLMEFTASQLAGAATIAAPSVTVTLPSGDGPARLAFDTAHDLWVACPGQNQLLAYTPAQLATSGRPSPSVVLSSRGSTLNAPTGLFVDRQDDLWVANEGNSTIVEFTPNELTRSGAPVSAETTAGARTDLNGPTALVLDYTIAPNPGYWVAAADSSVYNEQFAFGGGTDLAPNRRGPIVGIAADPEGGYWIVAASGEIFAEDGATSFGGLLYPASPVVAMAAMPDGSGYWLVTEAGHVYTFGGDGYHGGLTTTTAPIVGIASMPDGYGYWLVSSTGGVYTFGPSGYHGGLAGHPLNSPIVGIAAPYDGAGYWLVSASGGVYGYGTARYAGGMAGRPLASPMVGMAATNDGGGYWLVSATGGVFSFGDAQFGGSLPGSGTRVSDVVGLAAFSGLGQGPYPHGSPRPAR